MIVHSGSCFTVPVKPGQCSGPGQGAGPSHPGPGGPAAGSTAALGGLLCCLWYLGLKSAGEHCRCRKIECCLQKTSRWSYEPPLEWPAGQRTNMSRPIRHQNTKKKITLHGECDPWLLMLVTSFQVLGPINWDTSHLDHDKFPLPGPPIGPLLSKTQADFKLRQTRCLATLVGYHRCTTHKYIC